MVERVGAAGEHVDRRVYVAVGGEAAAQVLLNGGTDLEHLPEPAVTESAPGLLEPGHDRRVGQVDRLAALDTEGQVR